jgi:methylmalonyl-CoA/ethylmalonyl-CoA epimerase
MKLKRVDHVGVIVASLEKARQLIENGFGLEPFRHIKRDDLEATFFKCGGADIELIEIKDPAMREQRLGTGREARLEHIAFEVENLNEILAALEGLGIKTTGPPQVSPAYTTVWTEAHSSGDVMYQFMERPPEQIPE